MTWWTGSAVGLDFETDGPDPLDARIVTAATVVVRPGQKPSTDEVLAQPERDIPDEAAGIHGITTEMARANGHPRADVVREVAARLALAGPECPVVGHNVRYDLTVLDREMRRTQVGWLEIERNIAAEMGIVVMVRDGGPIKRSAFPVIDTLVLDKAVDRYRRGKRQLEVVARHYGAPMDEGAAHGATADVVASLRIAIAIANQGHHADLTTHDIHLRQTEWAAEQARSLRQYFIENPKPGRDPAGVREEWPFIPVARDTIETVDTTVL